MCPARGPRTELGPRGQHPPLRRGRVRVPTSGLTAPATRYPLPTPTTGAQAPGEGPRLPLPTLGLMGTPGDPEPPEPHAGGSRGQDGKRGRSHHAVLTGAARAGGRGRVASRGDATLAAGPENTAERAPRPAALLPNPRPSLPETRAPGAGSGTMDCDLGRARPLGSGVRGSRTQAGGGGLKTARGEVRPRGRGPPARGFGRARVSGPLGRSPGAAADGARPGACGWCREDPPSGRRRLDPATGLCLGTLPYLLSFSCLPSFRKLKTILG